VFGQIKLFAQTKPFAPSSCRACRDSISRGRLDTREQARHAPGMAVNCWRRFTPACARQARTLLDTNGLRVGRTRLAASSITAWPPLWGDSGQRLAYRAEPAAASPALRRGTPRLIG